MGNKHPREQKAEGAPGETKTTEQNDTSAATSGSSRLKKVSMTRKRNAVLPAEGVLGENSNLESSPNEDSKQEETVQVVKEVALLLGLGDESIFAMKDLAVKVEDLPPEVTEDQLIMRLILQYLLQSEDESLQEKSNKIMETFEESQVSSAIQLLKKLESEEELMAFVFDFFVFLSRNQEEESNNAEESVDISKVAKSFRQSDKLPLQEAKYSERIGKEEFVRLANKSA